MPLSTNDTFVLEEIIIMRGTFSDEESGTALDPDDVVLTVTDPDGDVTIADTDPFSGNEQLENPSIGVYEFRIELTKLLNWNWDFKGTSEFPLTAARRGGSVRVILPS